MACQAVPSYILNSLVAVSHQPSPVLGAVGAVFETVDLASGVNRTPSYTFN